MNRSLLLKLLAIFVLTLLILIPLGQIRDTVTDRQEHRRVAVASIAASYAANQKLAGPILVVPYEVRSDAYTKDSDGKKVAATLTERREYLFFPKDLQVEGTLLPGERYRGLHKVHVYELQSRFSGQIDYQLPPAAQLAAKRITLLQPYLAVGISDVRGLIGTPVLKLNDQVLSLRQGAGLARLGGGMHAAWPEQTALDQGSLNFSFDLTLAGTESLAITPVGDNNKIALSSSWPHPQFGGSFLPRTRSVSEKGFQANWEISSLASSAQRQLGSAVAESAGKEAQAGIESLDITLAEPVNIYSQADRATKYGLLFVLLTFVGFFMFEMIKQLPIHPIQYLLVGLGLAMFFLLLVSLSEHIAFWLAYLIASIACIGLLTFYLSHVLGSARRGFGFGAMLTALYGALYGLLNSEDNALVLGALMLFAILAAIMVVTRKIDWYKAGNSTADKLNRE